jgi:hypothetical protein
MLQFKTFLEHNQDKVQQLANYNKIFIYPNIPHAKLRGAIASYLDGVSPEEVLILVDNTLMGGAREGLAITSQGVFFKETPLQGVTYHPLEYVNAVGCDSSLFGGTKVTFNHSTTIDLIGPDRKGILLLVSLLNDYIQQRKQFTENTKEQSYTSQRPLHHQKNSSAKVDDFDNILPIIDILLHFAFMPDHDDEENAEYLMSTIGQFAQSNDHKLRMKSRIHLYPRPTLENSVRYFMSLNPDEELKTLLIVSVFGILLLNAFPRSDVTHYMSNISREIGLTQQQVNYAIKDAFTDDAFDVFGNQKHQSNSHNEQFQWACMILEIEINQISRDRITQAYRLKMKDYHPDKYQSLPEPIMQMLHEKAQELNQARDILMAHF